jgi:DNA-binding transcriptional LysR family regulator
MARRPYNFPSLNGLAAFEAAGRHMSFTDAASELNVTPGAVSKQIKQLESEVGAPLFVRLHRALDLTAEGAALHATLRESFSRISETLSGLDTARRVKTVSIGSTSAFAQFWLMPRLGRFWKEHQDIVVDHAISDRGHERLPARVDLRVRYGKPPFPDEEASKLFDDRIIAVASPAYAADRRDLGLADLASQPLLSVEGVDWTWTTWADFFRANAVKPGRLNIRRFNSYVIAVQAARDGQGIVLGWERLLAPLLRARALLQVGDATMLAPDSFYLCCNSRERLSAEAKTLHDWLLRNID